MSSTKYELLDLDRIPRHIAIIMDGNGRWAKQHSQERSYGHTCGVSSVRNVLKAAVKTGVKVLTLYTFSEENWKRPKEEVHALMALLVSSIQDELPELIRNNIRLEVIGDISTLPNEPKEALLKAIDETSQLTACRLILAVNYSARSEIIRATQRLVQRGIKKIDEHIFSNELFLPDTPDPDLLIRTGGELRISNFLLWQLAYTELYFTPTYWPDFGAEEFYDAILDYQMRERRFGKTSEQVRKK